MWYNQLGIYVENNSSSNLMNSTKTRKRETFIVVTPQQQNINELLFTIAVLKIVK